MKWSLPGKFLNFLAFSNIFLALSVTSLALETEFVLHNPANDFQYPFFLFSATLCLYCFHRLFRFDFRAVTEKKSGRHQWLLNHGKIFYFLFFIACAATLYSILFLVSWHLLLSLLPIALISVGYTVPCFPWKGKLLRLRDIPGIKIFLISIVLGLTTVLLPVLEHADASCFFHPEILFIFFRRLFFIFAITIPFDIRDKPFDQQQNTKTLPVLLGDTRSRRLAYLALLLFCILSLIQLQWLPGTSYPYIIALLISAVVSGYMVHLSKTRKDDFFYAYCLEGMMLLQCILIFSANKFLQ